MIQKILIILNEQSGLQFTSQKTAIRQSCKRLGLDYKFLPLNKDFSNKALKLRSSFAYDAIIAAGGDGTINAVVNFAVPHNLVVGVLPVGTLNHFAKDAGIPQTIDDALACIQKGHTSATDVASVNGHYFVNNSGIGFYPYVIHRRDQLKRYITKWPAMIVALIMELILLKRHRADLKVDTRRIQHKVSFIFIGNNSYNIEHGKFNRDSITNEGKLSIYAIKTTKVSSLIRIVWRVIRNDIVNEKAFAHYSAASATISWPHRAPLVSYDGEVTRQDSPLTYTIHPKKLLLIRPRSL